MLLSELGLTKRQITAFGKKHIESSEDLVQYFPKQYRDYRELRLIKDAPEDRYSVFPGELIYVDKRLGKKWYLVMKMRQDDGTVVGIMMFSETFRFEEFASYLHKRITVCGKPQYDPTYGWSVQYPERIALEEKFIPHIEPVYTKIQGITDETLNQAIHNSIKNTTEPLDGRLVRELSLMPYQNALYELHGPSDEGALRTAKQRISLNDMLYFADALGRADVHGTEMTDILFSDHSSLNELNGMLPYDLTEDQQNILAVFEEKTRTGYRFNALIQGDVGCGKTVVAIAMILSACRNGYQAALMAPREVLAKQHYNEVKKFADAFGFPCTFLASSMPAKQKNEELKKIKSGETQIIVGTHSCIADGVVYHRLGLIVTDEEHLFGVRQKELLEAKADEGVHAVSMSATPIPRSLATILYGQKKEIMTIHTMPKGRLPVKTAVQCSHANTFSFMRTQIAAGHQCYVVCPAIERNDEYGITSLEEMEAEYRKYFEPKGIRIGIVHGQIDPKEIEETITAFSSGDLDILMSTTVIEVGVNVPNATVMVVEQAERFGLASLHQLRGRVGRSSKQSYCILISKDKGNARLDTMVRTNDGFEIAEADLQQRGSGDLLGVRQAGNNRFVNEMLKNPMLFQYAVDVIKRSREKGYENHLELIYGDHAESVGEDDG